ncbi:uncharacterized protein RAG0_11851 [Rhynchosporium agropyri]|uniref:Uncharacterized protein n=1 Tax=Rhynchosporium agropyri TaxID=914238 RepID=A0A1E1L5Z9_9HELO|nr:uncharacterized protein RAG0_11851 [Rhynchosporium agropyri]
MAVSKGLSRASETLWAKIKPRRSQNPPSAEICTAIWILSNPNFPVELREMIFKDDMESHICAEMTPVSPLSEALRKQAKSSECTDTQRGLHQQCTEIWSRLSHFVSSLHDAKVLCMSLEPKKKTSLIKYIVIRTMLEEQAPSLGPFETLRPHTIILDTSHLHAGNVSSPRDLFHRIIPIAVAAGHLKRIILRTRFRMYEIVHASADTYLLEMHKDELDAYLGIEGKTEKVLATGRRGRRRPGEIAFEDWEWDVPVGHQLPTVQRELKKFYCPWTGARIQLNR